MGCGAAQHASPRMTLHRRDGMPGRAFVAALVWLKAIALAALMIFAPLDTGAQTPEPPRKLAVVSFGLFGDQDVFRSEATGAAQIVSNRFGGDPVIVKFNTKRGGGATAGALNATLQATAKKLDRENDVLFLILTSHGSHDGLAVVPGTAEPDTDACGARWNTRSNRDKSQS